MIRIRNVAFRCRTLFVTLLPFLITGMFVPPERGDAEELVLHSRRRARAGQGDAAIRVHHETLSWKAEETAIVICDMWDQHWCQGATRRVGQLAPRMNEVIQAARQRGVLIIHAPSSCLEPYAGTQMRQRARNAPKVETRIPLQGWCHLDPRREHPLPIDDSDGGCDCQPQCPTGNPWRRQIETLVIHPEDAITDSAEAYYLMRQRGIKNVIVMGVHTNMCVLGRPFSIRQMIYQGQNVVLMRDMTDSMYNSRKAPQVPHVRGTELVVEHIEQFWCPTITSTDFVGGPAFRFPEDQRKHVAIMVNDNHYDAIGSLATYVTRLQRDQGCYISWIQAQPGRGFVGTEALRDADLLILYARREALTDAQKGHLQTYLDSRKPLIALRTASHAFGPRGDLAAGWTRWEEFDREVLGGNYQGHFQEGSVIEVAAPSHPLLAGVPASWKSSGSLYKTLPLAKGCEVLLTGIPSDGQNPSRHAVAWIREYRGTPVFYTSLGHPDDFANTPLTRVLDQAVRGMLERTKSNP